MDRFEDDNLINTSVDPDDFEVLNQNEADDYDSDYESFTKEPVKAEFVQFVPISVICRARVAKMVNGRVVDEFVSGEVVLYHPFDQAPSLVNRVLEQLEGGR